MTGLHTALRALADEWTAVYERWNGVSDGPRVAIFNVHARKILALLAEHEPTPSDKAREGHIVHVTVEPVAEDVVWCEECEEWVSSGAPEGAPATPSDQALRDLRAGVEARDRIARVLYEEHFDREDDDWLSTADGSPNSASYALADRILASSAPATASEGVASCPHDELMSDPCAECYFDANADDGLPATGVTSSDGLSAIVEADGWADVSTDDLIERAIEAIAWGLLDATSDTADRWPSKESHDAARATAKRILAARTAGGA